MFDLESQAWIANVDRPNARKLWADILFPQLWEMGTAEAQSVAAARSRQSRLETYWLYQPSFRQILW